MISLNIPYRLFVIGSKKWLIIGVPRVDPAFAPILVCGPHTTWWDAMTIVLAAHCPGGVSRIESARAPILGRTYLDLRACF